jgi:hypothetical protein
MDPNEALRVAREIRANHQTTKGTTMPKFTYTVTVETDTQAEADQVIAERINYDEPYFEVDGVPKPEGITYTISAHGEEQDLNAESE